MALLEARVVREQGGECEMKALVPAKAPEEQRGDVARMVAAALAHVQREEARAALLLVGEAVQRTEHERASRGALVVEQRGCEHHVTGLALVVPTPEQQWGDAAIVPAGVSAVVDGEDA